MSDALKDALDMLAKRRAGLGALADEIRTRGLVPPLPPRRAAPGPVRPGEQDEPEPPRPTISPAEVERQWRALGRMWLVRLPRRDLVSVAAATAHHQVGPRLAALPSFVETLDDVFVRPRRRARVVGHLYFQLYPPPQHVRDALDRLKRVLNEDDWPPWWRRADDPEALAAQLAECVTAGRWEPGGADPDVPETVTQSAWVASIVGFARPQSVEAARHLVRFCDGGQDLRAPAVVTDELVVATRSIVVLGTRNPSMRMQLASLLGRRIGDVYGAVDRARWHRLEDERDVVRKWVSSELLALLFKHLVPYQDAHQTRQRMQFWEAYTGKVERLWLLIDSRLRERLDRHELRDMLERVGDLVEVRTLEGNEMQAILWMHLRSTSDTIVSVVEGNANAACRFRKAAIEPPLRVSTHGGERVVRYTEDIVRGAFAEINDARIRRHQGDWQTRLAAELRAFGVHP